MKATVHVSLKAGVLDPQGKAVGDALGRLGFGEVQAVRCGKVIEIDKPRRLVLSWKHERFAEMKDNEDARAIFELEQQGEIVKLTHQLERGIRLNKMPAFA